MAQGYPTSASLEYTVAMGDLSVAVDWNATSSSRGPITLDAAKAAGVFDLIAQVGQAVGVWCVLRPSESLYIKPPPKLDVQAD